MTSSRARNKILPKTSRMSLKITEQKTRKSQTEEQISGKYFPSGTSEKQTTLDE